MSDNFSADLAAASAAAITDLQTSTVPAEAGPAADATETVETPETASAQEASNAAAAVVEETPAAEAQADTTQPAAVAEENAKQKWVITRKGQQVEITDPAQAEELIRQGYDYTQKTMELAEQRRQLESEFARKVEEARAYLNNPDNLRAQLARLAPAQPAADPEALVSHAEQQAAIQAEVQRAQLAMQHQTQAMVQQALLEAETERYSIDYKAQVQQTLQTLTTEKFPILADVEKVDRLILDDVAEKIQARRLLDPHYVATIDDAKTLMVDSATRRAERLNARLKEHIKMETVRAAKVAAKTTEPAGGAAPPPPAPTNHKLGDKALTASVIAELQAAFDKKR